MINIPTFRPLSLLVVAWLALAVANSSAYANAPLRYAVLDSLSYPLVVRDDKGLVVGGLLSDMGVAIARELNVPLRLIPQSRRRIEGAVQGGLVDVACYLSPQWIEQPQEVLWTVESLPQVERVISLRGGMVSALTLESLEGKRVATQLGYRYPSLAQWFDKGKVKRMDETRVALMFKSVEVGFSDLLVTSEAEIEGYFHAQPSARDKYEVSIFVVSKVATQCAVSRLSPYPVAAIDKALNTLIRRGDLKRLAAGYRLTAP